MIENVQSSTCSEIKLLSTCVQKHELFLRNHLLASDSLISDCNCRFYRGCSRLVIKFCFKFSADVISCYKANPCR